MTDKTIQHKILEIISKNKKIDVLELKAKMPEYKAGDVSNNIIILVMRGCIAVDEKWKMSIGESFVWP